MNNLSTVHVFQSLGEKINFDRKIIIIIVVVYIYLEQLVHNILFVNIFQDTGSDNSVQVGFCREREGKNKIGMF